MLTTSRPIEYRGSVVGGAFAIAYILAIQLSERAYGSLAVPSPFWLPDSVLLCALLLAPRKHWWIFLVSACAMRWVLGALPGTPFWFVVTTTANDMLKAVGAAWILRRFVRDQIRLDTFNEFLVFVGVAAVAMPALSALAAAPARHALGDPLWTAAYRWFLGDALAQVVATPMILYWCTSGEA